MFGFGHRQIPCVGCLQSWLAVGLEIFFLSSFCHCLWFDGPAGCYVIWVCHSSPFQKAFWKVIFHPWLLNGKACLVLCMRSIHVNCWTWDDFWFDFFFTELILWYFLFGFRYCSLCFLVFVFVLWCWSVFSKSLSNCIHQRRCSTSEGISWNAGLGLVGVGLWFWMGEGRLGISSYTAGLSAAVNFKKAP